MQSSNLYNFFDLSGGHVENVFMHLKNQFRILSMQMLGKGPNFVKRCADIFLLCCQLINLDLKYINGKQSIMRKDFIKY